MEPLLVGVTLFSLALALTMTVVAWKLLREARDREAARTEALRAHAFEEDDGPADAPRAAAGAAAPASARHRSEPRAAEEIAPGDWDLSLGHRAARQGADWTSHARRVAPDARGVPRRSLAPDDAMLRDGPPDSAPLFEGTGAAPAHTRWLAVVAGALVVVAAAVTVSAIHSPEIVAAVAASRSADADDAHALQLLSLRQSVDAAGAFTVTGLVENPPAGEPLDHLQAIVYLFDASGQYFASGHAALDVSALSPGDESPFTVTIPVATTVSRYRVGFRRADGSVVKHVDRRGQMPSGTTGDAVDAAASPTSASHTPSSAVDAPDATAASDAADAAGTSAGGGR